MPACPRCARACGAGQGYTWQLCKAPRLRKAWHTRTAYSCARGGDAACPDATLMSTPQLHALQVYAAVFDGHGGAATADWLSANLLNYVEKVGGCQSSQCWVGGCTAAARRMCRR